MALTQEQINKMRAVAQSTVSSVDKPSHTTSNQNTPSKTRNISTLGDVGIGVGKGLLSSVRGAASIGEDVIKGLGRAVLPKPLEEKLGFQKTEKSSAEQLIPEKMVTPENTPQKVGFFTEQLAEFLIPAFKVGKVGAAAEGATKLKKSLGLAKRIAAESATAGTVGAVQSGEFGSEAKKQAALGAVVPFAGAAMKIPAKVVGNTLKNLAGAVTGKGSEVIEQVLLKPEAALKGMSGKDVDILSEIALKARSGVSKLQKEASTAYGAALKALPDVGQLPQAKQRALSTFDELISKFGSVTRDKAGKLNFSSSVFEGADESVLKRLENKLVGWTDYTPEGLNKLAQSIGKFRKGADARQFNAIVDGLKKDIRRFAGDIVPELNDVNASYANTMEFLDDIRSVLKIKRGDASAKQLREVSTKIQQVFNKNKQLARGLIEKLEEQTGDSILGMEAGRQLAEGIPRSTAAIGGAASAILQSIIPSKSIGQIVASTGIAQQKIAPVIEALNKLGVAERTALFGFISKVIGETNQSR